MTDNKEPRGWFRIEAKATDDGEPTSADVHIYDEIGERWYGGGVGARSFAEQIDALDVDTINLHLNSPGGAAWDGITIMNALRRHRARVEVTVDGLAASAASAIAMAGDKITMARGSMLMIHDASGGCWGPASAMEDTAGILHKLSDSYADIYTARAGKTREHWREQMRAESWYTAQEAVEAGLADEWSDAPNAEANAGITPRARYDMAMRARASVPAVVHQTPDSSEPGEPNRKENAVAYSDLTAGLRDRLGVTDADATDEALLAALDEALAEQAENTTESAAIPAVPAGMQLVDETVLADLKAGAKAGADALAAQTTARRDGIIDDALRTGRITSASQEHFRAMLEADEASATKLITSLATNTVNTTEIGKSDAINDADAALYGEIYGTKGA